MRALYAEPSTRSYAVWINYFGSNIAVSTHKNITSSALATLNAGIVEYFALFWNFLATGIALNYIISFDTL